jgi:hypothetical protein
MARHGPVLKRGQSVEVRNGSMPDRHGEVALDWR